MEMQEPLGEVVGARAKPIDREVGQMSNDDAAAATYMDHVSPEEEARVRRKLDFYLLPVLVLGFLALQLDRSNIGNALTNSLKEDIDLSLDQVNLGAQLLQIGIIVAEIPANIILQRVGPRVWLTFLLAVWGAIALAQAWITNVPAFYATRTLLGLFEGGFVPGSQYILSLFYRRDELALRTTIFYVGNYVAAGTGSLAAAGIFKMDGLANMAGWKWLFLIEGAFTILVAGIFFLLMPESPSTPRPIHGQFDMFTQAERKILLQRMAGPYGQNGEAMATITWESFKSTMLNIRPWLHFLLNVLALTPKGALALYSPSIIKSLRFDSIHANLLNSVSSYGVVVLSILVSLASDRFQQRGLFCIVAYTWSILFSVALIAVRHSTNHWLQYAMLTLLSSGNALSQALNDAWLSVNSPSAPYRSIGLAMVVIGSNIGGIVGPQLFQPSDAPYYTNGYIAIVCLYGMSILLTLGIMYVYKADNKKIARQGTAAMQASECHEDITFRHL